MTARTRIRTLPEPTWTQSDNDLLPKWMKYLEWHTQHEGNDELGRLQGLIRDKERTVEAYTRQVKGDTAELKRLKTMLTELENRPRLTDAELQQRYDALIALPYVAGTRVGRAGELAVLIDTAPLSPEGQSIGWIEVGYEYFVNGRIYIVGQDFTRANHALGRQYYMNVHSIGELTVASCQTWLPHVLTEQFAAGDIASIIAPFAEKLSELIRANMRDDEMDPPDTHADDMPWSGYVTDPVKALKALQKCGGADGVDRQIRNVKSTIREYERYKTADNDQLRHARAQLRDYKSQLETLQRARANANKEGDRAAARQTLEYISTLPGVIAIKFDGYGTPILHLRNSVVHDGKRYDLGDFELYLRTEDAYFGTTMKVRRTRCPAGGSYDRGWHPDANRFCFGRTSIVEILDAYRRGDFGHCVNIAIGIMNSLSAGHEYLIEEGQFAEIAMDNVWQRKLPTRPRRRRATQVAVGATALKTA